MRYYKFVITVSALVLLSISNLYTVDLAPALDGIIYPSSRRNAGTSVVLFCTADECIEGGEEAKRKWMTPLLSMDPKKTKRWHWRRKSRLNSL